MNESIKAGADIHAGDGGYSIGNQKDHDAFVKERNKSLNKEKLEEWEIKMQKDIAETKGKITALMENDLTDDDGYPTDAALEIIKIWHWDDEKGWFDFIKSIWHLRSWGWTEGLEEHEYELGKMVYRYNLSTAGWSGNESIIHAMEQNRMMMACTWVQSRRGGHYLFERRDL